MFLFFVFDAVSFNFWAVYCLCLLLVFAYLCYLLPVFVYLSFFCVFCE